MTTQQIQSIGQAVEGGWWAMLGFVGSMGFLGLWGWRALVGAHKLGRMEQRLCDLQASFDRMQVAFDRHVEAERIWQRDITTRLDRLIEGRK